MHEYEKFTFLLFQRGREDKKLASDSDTELTVVEKLNIVKDLIRKSVEESKMNRGVKRNRKEIIVGVEKIPVYEEVHGQLKIKDSFKEVIYTE